MVEYLVEQMTDTLVKDTNDNQNERLIVRYGLEVMVTTVFQTAGFLAIGLIFNRAFELCFIMLGFASLRLFAGGDHANSRMKCFLSSLASLVVPDLTKYFWVDFPRYGGDYFLNEVETTEYWMGVQADRTLKTQKVLYNSTSNELYCTNMYGTYSQSQGGAHEGIDFAIGTTKSIHAVFDGIVKSGGLYHQ